MTPRRRILLTDLEVALSDLMIVTADEVLAPELQNAAVLFAALAKKEFINHDLLKRVLGNSDIEKPDQRNWTELGERGQNAVRAIVKALRGE